MSLRMNRWRWLGVAMVAVLLVAVVGFVPRAVERRVRTHVLPKLSAKLGLPVEVEAIDVGWGAISLKGVRIGDVARVPNIEVRVGIGAAMVGRLEVGELKLIEPLVQARLGQPDTARLEALIRQHIGDLGDRGVAASAQRGEAAAGSWPLPETLVVDGGTLRLELEADHGQIELGGLTVRAHPKTHEGEVALHELAVVVGRGQRLVLRQLRLRVAASGALEALVGDGQVAPWEGFSLTNVAGTARATSAGELTLDLGGSYGGANEPLWTVKGTIDLVRRVGDVTFAANEFSLARLAAVVPHDMLRDLDQTKIDAALHVQLAQRRVTYEGSGHVIGLTVYHPMIAAEPLDALAFGGTFAGHVDLDARTVVLDQASLATNDVPFTMAATLALPLASRVTEAGVPRPAASLEASLMVPPVPCQTALRAVPKAIAPFLQDFALQGEFAANLAVAIDWNDLDAVVLDADIGLDRCQVKKAPSAVGDRLKTEFVHHVEVDKDAWLDIRIGPSNPDFVPYAALPPHVVNAVLTTEDPRFFRHHGFLPSEFQKALAENLKAGYFRLGASSITMQLVKNVLLYREKTLSRKFQELFLTWHVERVLTKERMLEIYFSVVEYGPGIYGISQAARAYFGKPVAELSVKEAVFLAKLLPSPKARYRQYCEGTLRKWMEDGIGLALERMLQKAWITQAQFDEAMATPLAFAPMTESREQCLERVKKAIAKARSTSPAAAQPEEDER